MLHTISDIGIFLFLVELKTSISRNEMNWVSFKMWIKALNYNVPDTYIPTKKWKARGQKRDNIAYKGLYISSSAEA